MCKALAVLSVYGLYKFSMWAITPTYSAIAQKVNIMVQSITLSMSAFKNPALMLAAVIRGLNRIPTKQDYAYTSNCYYMIESVKGLSIEDSIVWLENVESVISNLWHMPTALSSKKDDNQKQQHIGTLAALIREEYKESGKLPVWVNQILSGVKLEEIQTTVDKKGKRTNKVATIEPIGPAIETYKDSENESDGASPLIPQQRYTVAGLGIIAKRISNASGKQGAQIIECVEDSLLDKLSVGKSFLVDTITTHKWVVIAKDKDSGMIYATWHKTHKAVDKATASKATASKATASKATASKATATTPTKAEVLARVMALLETIED